jgi:hypothetical protein
MAAEANEMENNSYSEEFSAEIEETSGRAASFGFDWDDPTHAGYVVVAILWVVLLLGCCALVTGL